MPTTSWATPWRVADYDGGPDDNFHVRELSPAIDSPTRGLRPVDIYGALRWDDPGTPNAGSDDYVEALPDRSSSGRVTWEPPRLRSDDNYWQLNLPFNFPFYGGSYASVYVSSNGLLQFGTTSYAYDAANTTDKLREYVRIAPLWDDLRTYGVGDDIFVDSRSGSGDRSLGCHERGD